MRSRLSALVLPALTLGILADAPPCLSCADEAGLQQQQNYAGPLFHFTYRDMGSDRSSKAENFGLVRRDFSPKDGLATFRNVVRG